MKRAYSIINGNFLVTNINQNIKKPSLFWIKKIIWLFLIVVIFGITYFTFYAALYPNGNLFDVISLGAVFATLGSTMVSIASLLCNRYYEECISCINTLREALIDQKIAPKWLFLKRREVIKIAKGEYITYQSTNPKVIFEIGVVNLSIEIPIQKKDFYELELLKEIFHMKVTKRIYTTYLLSHAESVMESGLYMWECTYHILSSALLYKFYRNIIIVGTIFFISGLIAIFSYIIFIQGNFQHIVFTKVTRWSQWYSILLAN